MQFINISTLAHYHVGSALPSKNVGDLSMMMNSFKSCICVTQSMRYSRQSRSSQKFAYPRANLAGEAVKSIPKSDLKTGESSNLSKPIKSHVNQVKQNISYKGLTGGEIFHQMMLKQNVTHVFGYPGGAILPVFDAIYQSPYFRFILPRHEQGAGHMAEGYARATGKPGVVLVTSGPGATNVITPMQDALSDGVPLVVFSGQVPRSAIGTDAFQEADVVGISRSCTKWNVMVDNLADLPRLINEAFAIACSGRPGPVLVDLPKDITASRLNYEVCDEPDIPGWKINQEKQRRHLLDQKETLDRIAELINMSRTPVIYAGAGALASHEHTQLVRELSLKCNIPVTTTLQGMGVFDETHPLSLHMLGMHGSAYANLAMQKADLILALGARFDDRVTGNLDKFAPTARKAERESRGGIIHFDISPKNINKVVQVSHFFEGDLVGGLREVMKLVKCNDREEWNSTIQSWKKQFPFSYSRDYNDKLAATQTPVKDADPEKRFDKLPGKAFHSLKSSFPASFKKSKQPLLPQTVLERLNTMLAGPMEQDKVAITTGVGQHQMFAAQYIRWRNPRSFISSGGLGTMGFGLPAAIGVKLARPDDIVIDVDGDASFSMTAMELMTASEFNIGVKVLLLNNEFQGMVRQWQDLFYDNRYSGTRMTNPDFVKLAESFGCKGLKVEAPGKELDDKLEEFLKHDSNRPILLDCRVEPAEHVYPMVPAGKGLHEMVLARGVNMPNAESLI